MSKVIWPNRGGYVLDNHCDDEPPADYSDSMDAAIKAAPDEATRAVLIEMKKRGVATQAIQLAPAPEPVASNLPDGIYALPNGAFFCDPCEKKVATESGVRMHIDGNAHLDALDAAAAAVGADDTNDDTADE